MKSKYRGVHWVERINAWHASISIENEIVHLGYFPTEEQAFRVFKKAFLRREIKKLNKGNPGSGRKPKGIAK